MKKVVTSHELSDGIVQHAGRLLDGLDIPSTDEPQLLLHTLSVGLEAVDLVAAQPDDERRVSVALQTMLNIMKEKGS